MVEYRSPKPLVRVRILVPLLEHLRELRCFFYVKRKIKGRFWIMDSFTTFSQYKYVRPDFEETKKLIRIAVESMKKAESKEEAMSVFKKVNKENMHLRTMATVAEIRNTIDTKDAFYEAEMQCFYENMPLIDIEMQEFQKAVLNSVYLEDLKTKYGELYFVRMKRLMKLVNKNNVDNQVEESNLVQLYHKTAAAPSIQFNGETLNFYGLLKKMQDPDRKIRKAALTAWSELYQSIADDLNDIYTKLIDNRIRQAEVLGFKDYTEMMYLSMERFDYDREDVARYREMIRKFVVPLVADIYEEQRNRLGIDHLYYYDEDMTSPEGNAVPYGKTEGQVKLAQKMYHELSKETGEFFDFMVEHELFDLETRPGKMQGGYCTFLPDLMAPFIFSNFNGTSADVDVLTHEAGHAFEAYTATRGGVPDEIAFSTSEVAEIHSMSMEYLTYPWMEYFFKEKADQYRRTQLEEGLRVIPYMACVDEFQHEVYAQKMTDAKERYKLWHSLEEKYMPWRDYDGDAFLEAGGFWMQKQHIFMCPFYYIDYSLASMGAFEYYIRSLNDREEAWKDYYRLCTMGGSKGYLELLDEGNLSDPFSEGTVEGIMKKLRKKIFQ